MGFNSHFEKKQLPSIQNNDCYVYILTAILWKIFGKTNQRNQLTYPVAYLEPWHLELFYKDSLAVNHIHLKPQS